MKFLVLPQLWQFTRLAVAFSFHPKVFPDIHCGAESEAERAAYEGQEIDPDAESLRALARPVPAPAPPEAGLPWP